MHVRGKWSVGTVTERMPTIAEARAKLIRQLGPEVERWIEDLIWAITEPRSTRPHPLRGAPSWDAAEAGETPEVLPVSHEQDAVEILRAWAGEAPSDEKLERVADEAEFVPATAGMSYTETCRARDRAERRALYDFGRASLADRLNTYARFAEWVELQDGVNGYVWKGDLRRRIAQLRTELDTSEKGTHK